MCCEHETGADPASWPHVAIIVLNWNNATDTLACMRSLEALDYPNYSVLLVDNGSTDDSPDVLENAFPQIECLRIPANCGFCGGNNIGIKRAMERDVDYMLLLNNDVDVDSTLLRAFVDAAQCVDRPGFLSGKIYYYGEPNRIWAAMTIWNPDSHRFEHPGNNELDGPQYESVAPIAYASGCALFVKADVVRDVGLLDPRFYCYFEEVDWCSRAERAGYRNYFVPGARLWHKVSVAYGGKASPVVTYFRTRNQMLWAEKNLDFRERILVQARIVKEAFSCFSPARLDSHDCCRLRALFWHIKAARRDPAFIARMRGLKDYIWRRFGDCPACIKALLRENRDVYARITGGV